MFWLLACSGAPVEAVGELPRDTTVEGLHQAYENHLVVDVRSPEEFASGHVPGAVNIPLDQLGARMTELDPHKAETLYVVCAVGGRSAKATSQLRDAGFSGAVNVDGGTQGWIAAGHPVE